MAGPTSFQRKARLKVPQIPGTKPSLYNNQLLISSGVPSLDNVIGGGLAVGTVFLVEEDTFGSYAQLLIKYFVSEAIVTGQSVLLSSLKTDPEFLLRELPAPIIEERNGETKSDGDTEKLKIAWRYQNQSKHQHSVSSARFGHYYDLTKCMQENIVTSADITTLSMQDFTERNDAECFMNPSYCQLLRHIQSNIEQGSFGTEQQCDKRNILRIVLSSLGSPLWGENGGMTPDGTKIDFSLPRFLYALRSILRKSYASCLITVPAHIFHDNGFIKRLEHLCDTVVQLESFAGSSKEKNQAFKEYHGLLHIHRLPRLNSLTAHLPDTLDLAFKLRRKKFTIETLHLPPELSETASRDQEDPAPRLKHTTSACSGQPSKLDF